MGHQKQNKKVSLPNSKKNTVSYLTFLVSLFILLTIAAKINPYFPVDLFISRYIQSITSPYFPEVLRLLTYSGWGRNAFVMLALIVALLIIWNKQLAALFILLNILVEGGFFYLIAILVNRPRPSSNLIHVDFKISVGGYPSGHVMMYMVVFGFLVYLSAIYIKKAVLKAIAIFFLVLALFLIGIARIYSGQHWPSDILGGYILGSILLLVSIYFYEIARGRVGYAFPKLFPKSQEIL